MPHTRTFNIVVLPGDGVGPEVALAAERVLTCIGDIYGHRFEFAEHLIGGAAIDATGVSLPDDTTAACLAATLCLATMARAETPAAGPDSTYPAPPPAEALAAQLGPTPRA